MDQEDLSAILDSCLLELQSGVPLETVLGKYPQWQDELRPVLEAVMAVWEVRGSDTVPIAAMARSRARLMQEVVNRQEATPKPGWWERLGLPRIKPAPVASLIVIFSLVFTSLASAQSLPGQLFYPVKIAAEQVGINLPGSPSVHLERQENFDQRRLAEVQTLIARQSIQQVNFSGYLTHPSANSWRVAGIDLSIPPELQSGLSAMNGSMVMVQASLTSDGQTIVQEITPKLYTISGKLNSIKNNRWEIDDVWVAVGEEAPPAQPPSAGQDVQVQAIRMDDNHLQAVRIQADGHTYTETLTPSSTNPEQPTTSSGEDGNGQSLPTQAATPKEGSPAATPAPSGDDGESKSTSVPAAVSSDDNAKPTKSGVATRANQEPEDHVIKTLNVPPQGVSPEGKTPQPTEGESANKTPQATRNTE